MKNVIKGRVIRMVSHRMFSTLEPFRKLLKEIREASGDSEIVSVSYYKYKQVFRNLYDEFTKKGLLLSELDYDLVLVLLDYVKNNYEQICLVLNEMFELYEDKQFDVIRQATLNEFTLFSRKSRDFYDKYKMFFNIFDDDSAREFLNKFEYYISFLFYITSRISADKNGKYLKKVIDNLNEINKLNFDKVILNFAYDFIKIGETIRLYYQPEGEVKEECSSIIFYREENVFSDIRPRENGDIRSDLYDKYVAVFFHHPKFIIKTIRKEGIYLESCESFDEKTKEIIIYDFMFDSARLPLKDELENSRCTLESYEQLIHLKKVEVLKKKLNDLSKKIYSMKLNIKDIIDLFEELGISFELGEDVFSNDEMKVLSLANKKVKKIR